MTHPSDLSLLGLFYPHANADMSFTRSINALKLVILLCPVTLKMICFTTPQRDKQEISIISK